MYLRGSVLIIICQKTHCCVKRFFRKTDPDSKKVSQIKTRLRNVPTTKISLHFNCCGADTSSWVAFYWSFESAHKSSWLKLDERSRSVSHQNPVKHPVGGIKIDLPVTLALTLWPWPSTDQWFKCAKVQIIACAVWRRTLVWTSRDWVERFCFANPQFTPRYDQTGFKRCWWCIPWQMTNTPQLMSTVGRWDVWEQGQTFTFVMPVIGKWIKLPARNISYQPWNLIFWGKKIIHLF